MRRLLRTAGALGVLALPLLLTGTAHADTGSPSPDSSSDPSSASSASASTAPAAAGNSFRTAAQLTSSQGGLAGQASGAIGDYFYWSFQASAGEAPSITATVQLPTGAHRQGTDNWRLDLYDGLRRAQPCVSGTPQAPATADSATVQLSCTLPSIRSGAETWSNDPLPGTYYVRLTVGDLTEQDLGLPVSAQITVSTPAGDGAPGDGTLSTQLSLPVGGPSASPAPTPTDGSAPAPSGSASETAAASGSSSGGSSSGSSSSGGLWGLFSGGNARWWWTGGGAVAASLTAVAGFSLTRHPRRWFS